MEEFNIKKYLLILEKYCWSAYICNFFIDTNEHLKNQILSSNFTWENWWRNFHIFYDDILFQETVFQTVSDWFRNIADEVLYKIMKDKFKPFKDDNGELPVKWNTEVVFVEQLPYKWKEVATVVHKLYI